MNASKAWPIIRLLLFLIVGLMNTVFIRPEEVGTWKNYIGYALLIGGTLDGIWQYRQYRKRQSAK